MREKLTDLLLFLVRRINRYKDRCLSKRLHDIADQYDPFPTGEWK